MGSRDVIFGSILFVVVCVPVLTIAARLTMKRIVDSIIRLRESVPPSSGLGLERRVVELEEEVRQLRAGMGELHETVEFQQKLLAASPSQPHELAGVA
ncbi:MAG TPA: hypothetical protein VFJ82_27045 [Longimicrobium sp.]|nr:hypothetical protein [Longimicrobium sp.]